MGGYLQREDLSPFCVCSGFGKSEVWLVDSGKEKNSKFDSIRTKVRQEMYTVLPQKQSKGLGKKKISYKYTK